MSPLLDDDELDPLFWSVAAADVVEEAEAEPTEPDGAEVGVGAVSELVVVTTTTVVLPPAPELVWLVVITEVMTFVVRVCEGAVVEEVTVCVVLGATVLVDESEVLETVSDDDKDEVVSIDVDEVPSVAGADEVIVRAALENGEET